MDARGGGGGGGGGSKIKIKKGKRKRTDQPAKELPKFNSKPKVRVKLSKKKATKPPRAQSSECPAPCSPATSPGHEPWPRALACRQPG